MAVEGEVLPVAAPGDAAAQPPLLQRSEAPVAVEEDLQTAGVEAEPPAGAVAAMMPPLETRGTTAALFPVLLLMAGGEALEGGEEALVGGRGALVGVEGGALVRVGGGALVEDDGEALVRDEGKVLVRDDGEVLVVAVAVVGRSL